MKITSHSHEVTQHMLAKYLLLALKNRTTSTFCEFTSFQNNHMMYHVITFVYE